MLSCFFLCFYKEKKIKNDSIKQNKIAELDTTSPRKKKKDNVLNTKQTGITSNQLIKIYCFAFIEVAETTSRWIFWGKSKNQNFVFFYIFENKFFSRAILQALEFFFFFFEI
jgi:hypothetical protein